MKHETALRSVAPVAPAPANIAGKWTNELGSWVIFDVDAHGVVSGHYHSAVCLHGGPEDSDDLSGYVTGPVVSWTVRWAEPAITAWVGEYVVDAQTGKETIETLWQMTALAPDGQGGYWHSTYAGTDAFTRAP